MKKKIEEQLSLSDMSAADNTAADYDKKLKALLNTGNKKSKLSKVFIIAGSALVVGAAALIAILMPFSKQTDVETVYREYTVEFGDIVVGQTESSSISLQRETVQFPVTAVVEEIFVKAGSSVKEGDPLMRFSVSDIEASLENYDLQLEIAGLELEQTKLQLETKLLQAKQKLETSKEAGSLASDNKNLTVSELQLAYTKAENALISAQEELAQYTSLSATFEDDYRRLKSFEANVEYLEQEVNSIQSSVNSITSYSSELASAKSNLDLMGRTLKSIAADLDKISDFTATPPTAATLADNMVSYYNYLIEGVLNETQIEALVGTTLAKAQSDISGWITTFDQSTYPTIYANLNTLQSTLTSMGAYADEVKKYTSLSNSAASDKANAETQLSYSKSDLEYVKSAYEDFKAYYTEKYGNITDMEQLADKVFSLELELEAAKNNLTKAQLSEQTGTTSAQQAKENAQTESQNAAAQYELTEMELSQSVDRARVAYDDLLTQIDEAKAMLNDDGIVYAPCNGMVVSVSVSEGERVTVSYNSETKKISQYAQLLVMTNISDIYVPITISEEDILDVSIGQEASVTMNAFPGETFEAQVDTISVEAARIGAATISYTVNVLFKEKNERDIFEGMSAEVTLIQRAVRGVLYVNSQAVTNTDGVSTVLKKGADGSGVLTEVKTGFSDGRYVEIVSGLGEGDIVLMESAVGATGAMGAGGSMGAGGAMVAGGGNNAFR